MHRPKLLIVGSFVMDLIVTAEKFPNKGETVLGIDYTTAPGGKGANQAVQAARLGAEVTMVGKVGKDSFGDELLHSAKQNLVDITHVMRSDTKPSAVGNIQIEASNTGAENRIIVVSGANMDWTPNDLDFLKESMSRYDLVILQHEIPEYINLMTAKLAHECGVPVMLNPAPAAPIKEIAGYLTYISPNEHEAKLLTGISPSKERLWAVYDRFHEMGVPQVLITLGKNGAVFMNETDLIHCDCIDSGKPVDPTAAGDSFNGAFCTAIAMGVSIESAMQFASAAAGITVSKMGAQTSLPNIEQVLEVMQLNHLDTKPFEGLIRS